MEEIFLGAGRTGFTVHHVFWIYGWNPSNESLGVGQKPGNLVESIMADEIHVHQKTTGFDFRTDYPDHFRQFSGGKRINDYISIIHSRLWILNGLIERSSLERNLRIGKLRVIPSPIKLLAVFFHRQAKGGADSIHSQEEDIGSHRMTSELICRLAGDRYPGLDDYSQ